MTVGSPLRVRSLSSWCVAKRALGNAATLLVVASVLPLTLACKGSVKAEAKSSGSAESEVDFDAGKKRDEAWESEALPSSNSSAPRSAEPKSEAPPVKAALLGARHDLTPAGSPAPACECLAVVAGLPSRSGLSWSGTPPEIDPATQLVVALTSDQVSCAVQAPRASYMGYEVREADVVIQVEGAVSGRPLTQGAIVPRPMTGGKLLIESSAQLPYGKAVGKSAPCSIGY